jgi:hypothetical protein
MKEKSIERVAGPAKAAKLCDSCELADVEALLAEEKETAPLGHY